MDTSCLAFTAQIEVRTLEALVAEASDGNPAPVTGYTQVDLSLAIALLVG